MARNIPIRFLRTTRANLNTQQSANGLLQGEPYLVTDEGTLAIGTGVGTYVNMATKAQVDAIDAGTGVEGSALNAQTVVGFSLSDLLFTVDLSADETLKMTALNLLRAQRLLLTNRAFTDSAAGFAADTYVAGSNIVLPAAPAERSKYHALVKVSKTAAGTATPIFNLRIGTNGTTADTSRCSLTFSAGTAAADVALVELWFEFVLGTPPNYTINAEGNARNNLATTGWSGTSKQATNTSSAFDPSALAGNIIGLSYNGGASAAHTIQFVDAEWIP